MIDDGSNTLSIIAIILSGVSLLVTSVTVLVYYKQWQVMSFSIKKEEMRLVVGLLYTSINDPLYFATGSPGIMINAEKDPTIKAYYSFWRNIQSNQYLTSSELQNKITIYTEQTRGKLKPTAVTEEYTSAKDGLDSAIRSRFEELSNELKEEKLKSTIYWYRVKKLLGRI